VIKPIEKCIKKRDFCSQNIKINAKQNKKRQGVGCNENKLLKSSKLAENQPIN